MPHVVLFGDFIFDNRAYTGREPHVITHSRTASAVMARDAARCRRRHDECHTGAGPGLAGTQNALISTART